MKVASIFAILLTGSDAFAPSARTFVNPRSAGTSARHFGIDPSSFNDISQHLGSLQESLSTLTLADANIGGAVDAVQSAVPDGVVDVASDAADAVAGTSNGWFGFLTVPIEYILQFIHGAFIAVGVGSNSWGISIILLTVLIKAVTFPLTKTQLEGTNKMQAMQPQIKEIQAKYQSNPEVMNQKIAEFYQTNEINPLAGCLPALAQIPIFIGLYRAVLNLAAENKLNESFLWLPSLEGPTYGADPAHGSDWIFQGWVDGVPSLGWADTSAYLILPVVLVISQFASMQLMQPKTDDPAQQQSNAILKFLPLMIGWFSLNVPSALCLYWIVNNIVTTGTSVLVRNGMKTETVSPVSSSTTMSASAPQTIFSPPREKPSGFGEATKSVSDDGVKPITSIDAEIVEEDDGGEGMNSGSSSKKKRGGGKKKKRSN